MRHIRSLPGPNRAKKGRVFPMARGYHSACIWHSEVHSSQGELMDDGLAMLLIQGIFCISIAYKLYESLPNISNALT
eukprot:1158370-Pelagomonas_calceolata.AAC.8